ncbi:MAG: hypothetical protein PHE24_04615 [Patescibacteria group bacterium]|nr:hypothetical protein [Patescibacteria group bacterium]
MKNGIERSNPPQARRMRIREKYYPRSISRSLARAGSRRSFGRNVLLCQRAKRKVGLAA